MVLCHMFWLGWVEMDEPIEMTEKQKKAQRSRSVWLAVVLVAMAVMFYLITIVKLGPSLFDRVM